MSASRVDKPSVCPCADSNAARFFISSSAPMARALGLGHIGEMSPGASEARGAINKILPLNTKVRRARHRVSPSGGAVDGRIGAKEPGHGPWVWPFLWIREEKTLHGVLHR